MNIHAKKSTKVMLQTLCFLWNTKNAFKRFCSRKQCHWIVVFRTIVDYAVSIVTSLRLYQTASELVVVKYGESAKHMHFQIQVVVFSCQDKDLFRYVWYCGKKTNRLWLSVVCTLNDNDMRHHSGQNVLQTHLAAAPHESTSFWPLWWRVLLSIRVQTTLNHIRFVKYFSLLISMRDRNLELIVWLFLLK